MLCSLCTNGGCRTTPSALLNTLLLQNVSLLVLWPLHLITPSPLLIAELPSSVLSNPAPSLIFLVISSKSFLLLIPSMLSLECHSHVVLELTLVVVMLAPPVLALVASLATSWRRRGLSALPAACNTLNQMCLTCSLDQHLYKSNPRVNAWF